MAPGCPGPYAEGVCFNLTFESEADLAAIAAGMCVDAEWDGYAPDDTSSGSIGVPAP